jgi:hypothetical protein
MTTQRMLVGALVLLTSASSLGEGALLAEFARAQAANQAALREYTWKSRTEVALAGEVRSIRLEQVRFDLDGRLQRTPLSESGAPQQATRSGPPHPIALLRGRIEAKQRADVASAVRALGELAQSYAQLGPEELHRFVGHEVAPGAAGSIRLRGRDVRVPGDQLTLWLDAESRAIRRVEIETRLDGQLAQISSEHRVLEDGVSYQARTTARLPARELVITIDSFEHTRAGPG